MHELDFDGEALQVPEPNNLSVALTDYELLQVLADLPGTKGLPVALRGAPGNPAAALVIMPTVADLPALVALARLRPAVTGPPDREDASDAQEPAQPQDGRLERAADDMQAVLERALTELEVDDRKFDHQNRAGDLVGALLAVLRRHDYLPVAADPLPPNAWRITRDYYLSNRQDVRAAVAKGISTASLASMREAQVTGQRIMEHLDALFESRDVAR